MNQRFKELAVQAGFQYNRYEGIGWAGASLPKFAELIVKECLFQVDKIRDGMEADGEDQQALGADWAGLAIARHFGVE
jgi:hypothetical protein